MAVISNSTAIQKMDEMEFTEDERESDEEEEENPKTKILFFFFLIVCMNLKYF